MCGRREMRHVCRPNSDAILISLVFLALASLVFVLTKDFSALSLLQFSSSLWSTWTSTSNISMHPPSFINDEEKKKKKIAIAYHDAMEQGLKDKLGMKRCEECDEKLKKLEAGLAMARALIKEATLDHNCTILSPPVGSSGFVPHGDIYRNPCVFHRSYLLMEKLFKIFIYEEGEPPLFHYGSGKDIYSMEGVFLSLIEMNTKFRTSDPDEAHVYLLPFSVVMILEHLFDPVIRDKAVLERVIGDYVRIVSHKYPYWNRSLGADHFMLSCHDWGPRATWYVRLMYFNSIRVLCNANTSENFNPKKDASFPEINLIGGNSEGLTGGLPPLNRTILAFFAGAMHGKIRPALFQHWKDKDDDIQVYETLPYGVSYPDMMKKSRYCICPSGHEVASPRIPEAIYAECVPVLISQHYILPFSDVLNWDSFSIQISVGDVPNLKNILTSIPFDQYLTMQERVRQVQHHFVINNPPKRFDVFHMIIHSIWLRRLNIRVS